jgi:hypothetical protein
MLFLCSISAVVFALDTSQILVDFQQDINTQNNNWDITYYNNNAYLGQVQVLPGQDFYDNHGFDSYGNPWLGELTLVISSPLSTFQFTLVGDDTKTFPITIDVMKNGSIPHEMGLTESPAEIPIPLTWGSYPTYTFLIDITTHPGKPTPYRGTYYSVLRFELYYNYNDEANRKRVGDEIYTMTGHFINQGGGGQFVQTDLLVERYTSASNIDVPALQTTESQLKVGMVNFFSDDDGDSGYTILISPGENPFGKFAFFKTGNSAISIPYKVFVTPERSLTDIQGTPTYGSQERAFSVVVSEKGISGFWQDSFELGIAQMNYEQVSYTTGDYTSLIQIELVRN